MIKRLVFLINILIGFIIILYTIYVRFIIVRLPKELWIIQNLEIKYRLIILISIGISICIFQLIISGLILYKYQPKDGIFSKISLRISEIIDNALFEVYNFCINLIPNNYDYVSYLSQKFYKYFSQKEETLFLFILYGIRFIIVIAFLIDVFLFFKLSYMYKALYLLGFSLLIKILFYMLKDFSNNLEEAKSYLIIEESGIDKESKLPITSYKIKDPKDAPFLDYYVGQYILCSKVSGYLEYYNRYSRFFIPFFHIILYSLYLIGWIYVIFKNLI